MYILQIKYQEACRLGAKTKLSDLCTCVYQKCQVFEIIIAMCTYSNSFCSCRIYNVNKSIIVSTVLFKALIAKIHKYLQLH